MDTSIIVVIAIVVVFAVAVPAMIRKSATELSRAEIDTVPDNAAVVPAETPNPGHDHSERTQVFRDKPRKAPSVPSPKVSPVMDAPALSLSATTREFSVIDGQGQPHTHAEVADVSQLNVLPVAVGETHAAFADSNGLVSDGLLGDGPVSDGPVSDGLVGGPTVGGSVTNVRMLHPAVHAVFNDSTRSRGQQGTRQRATGPQPTAQSPLPRQNAGSGSRTAHGSPRPGGGPRGDRSLTGQGGHLGEGEPNRSGNGPQISHPNFGTDEEHAMTEQATTLRESLRSLNTMVKGFAVVFLAAVLGIFVTGVLAVFSVVHIALAGIFLGLAIGSLFIVRTLNLRKLEVKKRLRTLKPRATAKADAPMSRRTAPMQERSASAGSPRTSSTAWTTKSASTSSSTARTSKPAPSSQPTSAPITAARTSTSAPTSSGTAARIAAAAQGGSATTKAAQARAAMARSAEAKKAREEADTGEIPLVRIRKEATEGHTTRQVLLTGPIPVVKDTAEATADSDREVESPSDGTRPVVKAAERSVAKPIDEKSASPVTVAQETAEKETDVPLSLGADLVAGADTSGVPSGESDSDADAHAAPDAHAAADAASAEVVDPFMQRLKSRDGWSPTPLPVPSYVDAPEAAHPVPSAAAADASSYETEARSREDIAAQFAAELGYRPELSDSAREDGPLEHGRKAIRTTKTADLGAVNDVLARRRA